MEAPLSICTKEEIGGVIRFLFAEGFKPVEIIRRMQAQYGDNCLSRSKIYEWINHFKKGRTSVCDEERSGRTSTSRTENNIQAAETKVPENRRITVNDNAEASICLVQ
jgi:transposase